MSRWIAPTGPGVYGCASPRCDRSAVVRLTATDPTLSSVYIGACQPDGSLRLDLCDEHRNAFARRRPTLTLPDGTVVPFTVCRL